MLNMACLVHPFSRLARLPAFENVSTLPLTCNRVKIHARLTSRIERVLCVHAKNRRHAEKQRDGCKGAINNLHAGLVVIKVTPTQGARNLQMQLSAAR